MSVDPAPVLRMVLSSEHDVFVLRQRGREVAAALGMDYQDQVRVATALSEIGRQVPGAEVLFAAAAGPRPHLVIVVSSAALGNQNLEGVRAAGRLMDEVRVEDERIVLTRRLPAQVDAERVGQARAELAESSPTTALDELSVQNRQLVAALEEVQAHRDELLHLNAELEETNKGVMALYTQLSEELEQTNQGVVALYAELDERSAQLREANEAKSRFLANVSHELRAPVTAIIGLTRLLLDPRSEPLTSEQTHQLDLVQGSAADLLARVNDLLDLAKAESGRIEPNWGPIDLAAVFGQLRGTLRPLARPEVELAVDEPPAAGLVSDELLLTQILRNLLTNALKFTDTGTVGMGAWVDGERLYIAVADTGLGIPFAEQARVFEEFHQVRGARQAGGTGLGLPYARRLATLLGGALTMVSEPGEGSTFTLSLPLRPAVPEVDDDGPLPQVERALVVDDDPAARHLLRQLLAGIAGQVSEAADVRSGLAIAVREHPSVIFLDLRMPGGDGTELLADLAGLDDVAGIPVFVVTAADLSDFRADELAHARSVLVKEHLTRRAVVDLVAGIAR
ncbi:ATP-binding response regulator [Dactylosporangium matsuzakiense]|uniref:histidine kinase n=1 Tax=Dactylosporangium matsuzakiense TaxID=53360 RepID=A0A9W6KVS4_9ACTN|nr:ATP-binding protein [Dactylosporangium matsuzakiense]UWZ49042.1 response regulator [Dactylosporangium matsuzakiense]GLL08208.1 sensor histidine kinase [Dactylosporangium matsuzakiense]